MLALEILPYEIGGIVASFLFSSYNKYATKQEVFFVLSHVVSSVLIIKFLNDEFKDITDGNGKIYGRKVSIISIVHYLIDILILYNFRFKGSYSKNLITHHIISIIIFLFLWKYYSWDEPTVISGTLWRCADIFQALYTGWIIPINESNFIKNILGRLKVSLRLSAYIVPFIILYTRDVKILNEFELYNAVVLQLFLQFILDYNMTIKFIKEKETWFFLFLLLLIFYSLI
tara:strand:- start:88 stop:777 length:690 start_codon:yes stop_codon:yes gene_type:complete